MSSPGRLFAMPESPALGWARALGWAWRLGEVAASPDPAAVGVGADTEADTLATLVDERKLAGAVIFAGGAGPAHGPLPARRVESGVARFADGVRVTGSFTLFDAPDGQPRSSLGLHAVRAGRMLVVGCHVEEWALLDRYWVPPTIGDFLIELLDRPLVMLPPIGCLRLDDYPGTAQHQVQGRAKSDSLQRRRLGRMVRNLRRADAKLVIAVAAAALVDGREVPADEVWPTSVAALSEAVRSGVIEPACHGTLHLDTDAWSEGRVEPREFAHLDRDEAGRRLDRARSWLEDRVGTPPSFIAPAWGYSPGTIEAAAERELPTWLPPSAAPLLEGLGFHETLRDGLPGLFRLDYRPLARLAAIGLPPTVVFHGRLLDHRRGDLSLPQDALPLAQLAVRRDLTRIPHLRGLRWVGAGELVRRLRAHDVIEVNGREPSIPAGAEAVVLDRSGAQLVSGASSAAALR